MFVCCLLCCVLLRAAPWFGFVARCISCIAYESYSSLPFVVLCCVTFVGVLSVVIVMCLRVACCLFVVDCWLLVVDC